MPDYQRKPLLCSSTSKNSVSSVDFHKYIMRLFDLSKTLVLSHGMVHAIYQDLFRPLHARQVR